MSPSQPLFLSSASPAPAPCCSLPPTPHPTPPTPLAWPQASERDYDLNRAAELKYGTLLELQRALQEAEAALQSADSRSNRMLHSEVTEDDIAEIVAKWTGIPVSSLKARSVGRAGGGEGGGVTGGGAGWRVRCALD